MKIAIIGAGVAGLSLANSLARLVPHWQLQIFEKSSFPGGRVSTRITPEFQFDHGAPFFCARSKAFKSYVHNEMSEDILPAWEGKKITREKGKKLEKRLWFEKHLVGQPTMRSFASHLAAKHTIHYNTTVTALNPHENRAWTLESKERDFSDTFDHIALCIPAPQALALVSPTLSFYHHLREVKMHACYSWMLGGQLFKKAIPIFTKVRHSPIRWIVADHLKPGRDQTTQKIVVYSDYEWADQHIDTEPKAVAEIFKQELSWVFGEDLMAPSYEELHRWKFAALKSAPKKVPFLFDPKQSISAAGDFCLGSSVDEAFRSGELLAEHLATC